MTPPGRWWLNLIPNGLSVARIGMALALPATPPAWRPWLVLVAAATDALDGASARWLRVESATGRMLDPVADKVFVLVLLGTLIADGSLPLRWAVGLAARDVIVLAGLVAVAASGRWRAYQGMRPSWLGKATTAGQFAGLLAAAWGAAPEWLLGGVTIVSVAAGVDYLVRFARGRLS